VGTVNAAVNIGKVIVLKVVFDTNVVISATLFRNSHLSPLRAAWQEERLTPTVCAETNAELMRVLAYKKFKLTEVGIAHVLALYLPYAQSHKINANIQSTLALPICRDVRDQIFLELAKSANADFLVSGDDDLLSLAEDSAIQLQRFRILTPAALMQKLVE
jgi:uncharacterized protein